MSLDGDAGLADIDGDGLDDVVLPLGSRGLRYLRGGPLPARVPLGSGTTRPLPLPGGLRRARSAAPVGDWNGDGRADVATVAGATGDEVAVVGLGWSGVRWRAGTPIGGVQGAGDVNGDGAADVLVWRSPDRAWVVFGGRPPADLSLAALGEAGLTLTIEAREDDHDDEYPWVTVLPVGDLDADGRADLAVEFHERYTIPSAHIVLGRATGVPRGSGRMPAPPRSFGAFARQATPPATGRPTWRSATTTAGGSSPAAPGSAADPWTREPRVPRASLRTGPRSPSTTYAQSVTRTGTVGRMCSSRARLGPTAGPAAVA
jgi:hypothetical protein